MLTAVPKGFFSWDFTLLDADRPVAEVGLAFWPERGTLAVPGATFTVRREGLLSGAFLLESAGKVIARAQKPSVFKRRIEIEFDGDFYILETASYFGRAMRVKLGEQTIGSLQPQGFFSWRMDVDLPDGMPLPTCGFIFWLAVVLWKRDAESSGD
ncbi:MAG: hypothetical protein EOM80_12185 [Erysipelotrichia bacterium]|nr:hypothetical protein [Erysipelotrichia bacterium]